MTNPQGPPTPAGWFRDPAGSGQLRWWDGNAWTAHLAPVPTPQPAPTPTIPQASPATPVDPDERPYVPFQNAWSSTGGGYGTAPGEFARPAQWNTAGVWFLATSPIWSLLLSGISFAVLIRVVGASGLTSSITEGSTSTLAPYELCVYLVFTVLALIAAGADRSKLKRLGYLHVTSPLWILLLGPLLYLILRTVRVKRESGRGLAPMLFYAITEVLLFVLAIGAAIAIPVFLATHDGLDNSATETANATSLATGITSGMEQNGGSYSVTCTPFSKPKTSPVEVTCIAVDLHSQKSHTLQIEVDPGTNGGQPTVKLLSVNPPISQ